MVEKNSFKEILRQKLINLAKKTIFTAKDRTSFTRRYKFEDRSKNSDTLCIILAGYKENLWDIVFDRIDKFSDEKMDICIVSSGLYSEKLSQIAKEKNWSYVSTKQNSVGLIQNMALKLFPEAKWIYKLDEDIFVTENFFKVLKDTYDKVQDNGDYNVGFVAPVIPINSFGYYLLLKKLNLEDYFEENFEKIKVGAMGNMIELDGEVAKFMWGKDNYIPHIDDLNKETFKVDTLDVSTIPAPYNTQDDMKYFNSISNVLFVSETFVSMDRQPSTTIYIGDKYFKAQSSGITHTNYTNISREKYAYEAVIKSNIINPYANHI